MSIKSAAFYEWTGTTSVLAETKLQINPNVWKGKFPVLTYTDIASGAITYTEDRVVGLQLQKDWTSIGDARITKVHGTYQPGHTVLGGSSVAWVNKVAAAAPSTVATVKIPTHLKPTTELEVAFDATTNEFQHLYLQHKFASVTSRAYDPAEQEGQAGYPLIQVAFPYLTKDPLGMSFPGANAPESIYNRTSTWLFWVDENDDFQLLGCFAQEMPFQMSPEWATLVKGSMGGIESFAFNGRPMSLTGSIYSMGGAVWEQLFHADNRGSDGRHTEYVVNTDWKPVAIGEFVLATYSDKGREMLVRFPNAAIRATGEFNTGGDAPMVPFEVVAEQTASVYVSNNLYDVHWLALDLEIT